MSVPENVAGSATLAPTSTGMTRGVGQGHVSLGGRSRNYILRPVGVLVEEIQVGEVKVVVTAALRAKIAKIETDSEVGQIIVSRSRSVLEILLRGLETEEGGEE